MSAWTDGGKFHTEIRLKDFDEHSSLHSINLIDPAGRRIGPDKWEDETPRSWRPSLGIGVGIPFARYFGIGAGVSVPLGKRKVRRITAVDAQWKLKKIKTITNCRLEINIAASQLQETVLKRTFLNLTRKGTEERRGAWEVNLTLPDE